MPEALADLQPSRLWKHFAAISAIPRSSRNEAAITRYVVDVATRAGCTVRRDRGGRLLIKSQASPGHENVPSVCLQSHLEALKLPLELESSASDGPLQRHGNSISTPRALIAADQSVTLAAMLALIEDPQQVHGPLECLLTLDEEGAAPRFREMDPQLIESRLLFNLNGEEEGTLTAGSPGTNETIGSWKPLWEEVYDKDPTGLLQVRGLTGGHAGFDISKFRGNAIKILVRVLLPLHDKGVRIASLQGGGRRHSIPREAEAMISIPHKRLSEIQEMIGQLAAVIREELKESDPEFTVDFQLHSFKKGKVLKRVQIRRILHVIHAMPNGVLRMSPDHPGLVQTSTHIGAIATARKLINISTVQRSLSASELEASSSSVASLLDIGGANIEQSQIQAAAQPQAESRFLQLAEQNFEEVYSRKPALRTLQNGAQLSDREMVSFGPPMHRAGNSEESIDIAAVERYWQYLEKMVQSLSSPEYLH